MIAACDLPEFPMTDPMQVLSESMLKALIHEDEEQFIVEAFPCVFNNPVFGVAGSTESETRLFLRFMFRSFPLPGIAGDKKNAKLPGRNDPCLCGSGKKFKACCVSFKNLPLPPLEAMLFMALREMTASQAEQLINKPLWSLSVLAEMLPILMRLNRAELVVAFFQRHIDVNTLSNQHAEMVAAILDALFDLRMDDERLALMQQLSRHKKAKSLQSLAYQRLAMIAAQNGEHAEAQALIQQAMRADPNQEELPMAELSILGPFGDDAEIRSRARFWHGRLSRRYGPDYPRAGFIQSVIQDGKSYFSNMLDDIGFAETGSDADAEQAERYATALLSVFEQSSVETVYQLKGKDGEVKLLMLAPARKKVKAWQQVFTQANEQLYALWPEEDEDWVEHQRWFEADAPWLQEIIDHPTLLSSLEVLLAVNDVLAYCPVDLSDDDASCIEAMSVYSRLQHACHTRMAEVMEAPLQVLRKNGWFLPCRFKANQPFWAAAQEYILYQSSYIETEKDIIVFLRVLMAIDNQPALWAIEKLAITHFYLREFDAVVPVVTHSKKRTLAMGLMLACAEFHTGENNGGLNSLLWLQKNFKKDLVKLSLALQNREFSPLFELGLAQLGSLLLDEEHEDSQQWLIRHLPKR
jgi:hypothetical protein